MKTTIDEQGEEALTCEQLHSNVMADIRMEVSWNHE